MDWEKSGRSDWIRTSDPYPPRIVRYRAALRSDCGACSTLIRKAEELFDSNSTRHAGVENLAGIAQIAKRLAQHVGMAV